MGETAVTFNVTSHAVGQVTTYLLSNNTDLNRLVGSSTDAATDKTLNFD